MGGCEARWRRPANGKAQGEVTAQQPKEPALCFAPSGPHWPSTCFVSVNEPSPHQRSNCKLPTTPTDTSGTTRVSPGPRVARARAARPTSAPRRSQRLGPRHREKFSRDGEKGRGEVKKSGGRDAGKTADSSQAPKRAQQGQLPPAPRPEKSPDPRSRPTNGRPGDQVPKAVLHPLPFCLP